MAGQPYSPGEPDFANGLASEGLKSGSEIAKQLITLSVGMIALTISFLKDIVNPNEVAGQGVPDLIIWAWLMYSICILSAIATLMGICGAMTVLDLKAMKLRLRPGHDGAYDVYAPTVRVPMLIMVLSFMAAIGLTIAAAANAPIAERPEARKAQGGNELDPGSMPR